MTCNLPQLWQDEQWLTKNPERISSAQVDINRYLRMAEDVYKGKKLLHIGIGNSSMFRELSDVFAVIDGMTNVTQELEVGRTYGSPEQYRIYMMNKHDPDQLATLDHDYDIIADTNLKSFSCCIEHWMSFLEGILNKLKPGGKLISHTAGFGGYMSPIYGNVMDNSLKMEELVQLLKPGQNLVELTELQDSSGYYPFMIEV